MKQALDSPNKNETMAELFPKNDDEEYQEISQVFKKKVKEQSNIEAREMFMITDAVQRKTCYHDAIPGHTYAICGQANTGASNKVQEQVFKKTS